MRRMCVQFQPGRVAQDAVGGVVAALRDALRGADFDAGNDGGRYVNVTFEAATVAAGWAAVASVLADHKFGQAVRASCIVTCQGEHGWDDYLLLHHFDPDVNLDLVVLPSDEPRRGFDAVRRRGP